MLFRFLKIMYQNFATMINTWGKGIFFKKLFSHKKNSCHSWEHVQRSKNKINSLFCFILTHIMQGSMKGIFFTLHFFIQVFSKRIEKNFKTSERKQDMTRIMFDEDSLDTKLTHCSIMWFYCKTVTSPWLFFFFSIVMLFS